MEGRGFLAVKGATGPVIAALNIGLALVPGHTSAHEGRNRHSVTDLIEKGWRKTHRATGLTTGTLYTTSFVKKRPPSKSNHRDSHGSDRSNLHAEEPKFI